MELSLKLFYTFGMWCMVVIGLANTWGFVNGIVAGLPIWALIVSFGGICLNCMFAGLFGFLANQQQQIPNDLKEADNLKELFQNG